MEYKGGPYDRDPYGQGPSIEPETGYEETPPRGRRGGAEGYDASPYSQSPYGRSPYGASYDDAGSDRGAYGGSPYSREYARGAYGRDDARGDRDAQDAYAAGGREERGYGRGSYADGDAVNDPGYGRDGYDPAAYGRGDARGYDRAEYGQDRYGRDESAYGRASYGSDYDRKDAQGGAGRREHADYGSTGRVERPEYGTGRVERPEYGTGRMERPAYGTGRMERPAYDTGRIPVGYETGRTPRPDYDDEYAAASDEEAFTEDYDDEEPVERPRRKKKKRSKFARFMRGLGAYIAQLPARTLIIFGGSVAVILVAVILLVMLLPKQPKEAQISDGELGLSDITPTPSLAPTEEPVLPEATDAVPEAAPIDNPFTDGSFLNLNDENDIVPTIQERLVELGYMDMPGEGYTTKYGPATKTAVRLFQIRNVADYHDWDGLMGESTYNLLMAGNTSTFYLARGDGDDRTKDITRLVELVNKLQTRLIELGYLKAGGATGRYGEDTVNAVRLFQQYHGLKVDGQAGQSTLTILYTAEAMDATTGAANDRSKMTPAPDAAAATPDPNAAATVPADAAATPAAS